MIIADWIAIGLIVFFALLGLLVGFGRGLRFFTKGFFGFLITILVCYCLGGFILKISFVEELLLKFVASLEGKGTVCDILIAIHIEIIVYYIVLFIAVLILKYTIVKLIAMIFEIDNIVIKVINRIVGVGLFLCVLALFVMIAFQIVYLIGGTTVTNFQQHITGSIFKLDWLFENNPLMTIIKIITIRIEI